MKKRCIIILLVIVLLLVTASLSACGKSGKPSAEPQPVIIEPGLANEAPPEEAPAPETPATPELPPEEEFTDLGRASTLDDLMANKAKIESYYFEQTIGYEAGDIHIHTWYKNGIMKIVSSYPGAPESVDYFDCYAYELITYTPSAGKNAVLITYEEGDAEVPNNPLNYNYHDYRVLETASIEGQVCRVLENSNGDKLWVGTKYGFPMQVEFVDSLTDEHFVVPYENITINQVTDEDVAIPTDLVIYEMVGGVGY